VSRRRLRHIAVAGVLSLAAGLVLAVSLSACGGESAAPTSSSPSPSASPPPSATAARPADYTGIWIIDSESMHGTKMVIRNTGEDTWLVHDQHFTTVKFDAVMRDGRLVLTSKSNGQGSFMSLEDGTLYWVNEGETEPWATLHRLSD
jgi:hypothetical protein